ncbi:efflux RND transporter permease subunit [Xanthocytophaga agilis]|uniref:Efflux RND transporter permease subunit n=1 Tax=Xanthocytophaga agilis TaxID=3048010 RepID=A0AAE3UIQ7_9BACT|nr:efflux RND transporter permease subunit [Xanthocytophaga agilis]MDJ1505681.1 efflux RND transporter permease subunit [Xanthocytophaga agilis]
MSLLTTSLKRPVSLIVILSGLLLFSVLSALRIPIDIFPRLNLPTIYVIEPYGGMSAQQMEGFFATRMQDQFLYVSGIKGIQSRSVQGLTILKLSFYEDTDMAQAAAEVAIQVNRAMKFFPAGALPPQVVRYDASSLPVGDIIFSSKTRSLQEIHELAVTRIRPLFSTVPGLSAPPPIGTNSRTIVVNLDPEKIRSLSISPDEVIDALARNNTMTPSGNIRIENTMYVTTLNSLEKEVEDFNQIPVVTSGRNMIFLKDIATVQDASDITAGYALVNGKRSSYIPVVKTPDASTWSVVSALKAKLPEMRSLLPDDIEVNYEFDQSVFVINAVKSLLIEGGIGALFTGLMVLLFLGDLRSSMIVIITIPVSVFVAILCLLLSGQTLNLMTLSGLALSIGILVDMATVTIENIHQHLEQGKPKKQAVLEACQEIALPLLLILLCILAVFSPALIMSGVPRAMFLPLSLSIGFAMTAAYFLAQSLVPILTNWWIKDEPHDNHSTPPIVSDEVTIHTEENSKQQVYQTTKVTGFERFRQVFLRQVEWLLGYKKSIVIVYVLFAFGLAATGFLLIGKDLMPKVNSGQLVIRMQMPDGTRLERTEQSVREFLTILDELTDQNVAITSAYVGVVPTNYATTNLYISTSGSHDAVIKVSLTEGYHTNLDDLKEKIRQKTSQQMPQLRISFEPADLTDKLMSQGAYTPIEVQVAGRNMDQIETYANELVIALQKISSLRDVRITQPLKFPVISISLDRIKLSQMGLKLDEITRSITTATSSSRYISKNQWLDESAAYTYQIQVQVPEFAMRNLSQLREIPLVSGQMRPVLSDVAEFAVDTVPGEYSRIGPRRYVTVSANVHHTDLATATNQVEEAIDALGAPPKGLLTEIKGMSSLLVETLTSLQTGLGMAVVVIFLLLAANFQSFRLSLAVLTSVPAVIAGSVGLLLLTGDTLNLQSYMGMIMSVGISVANAILIVTNAENFRLGLHPAREAAKASVSARLRPVLMTSLAMTAGMIPMASGLGEAGEQTAPLGRAVIGGLIASTLAALYIVPLVYTWLQERASLKGASLLPEPADLPADVAILHQTALVNHKSSVNNLGVNGH